jgi:hypothetical protein
MPFLGLFTFTIGAYLLQAALPDSPVLRQLITLTYLYAIWLALAASGAGRGACTALLAVWACTVLLRVLPVPGFELAATTASRATGALLLAICVFGIARHVLLSRRITADTLFAAAVVYILLASAFGQVFTGLHLLLPGAFLVPPHLAHQLATNPDQLFNYFSFVTLATLGYGEILPLHPVAQVLVSVETVLGQLYVAVVVAWLVGHVALDRRESLNRSDQ